MEQLRLGLLLRARPQLVEDFAQELEGIPAGVRQEADLVPFGLQALDQRPRERRLAASILARQHRAALALAHGVDHPDQRFLVLRREVEELRVRRVVEWRFTHTPIRFVHDAMVTSS